MVAGAGAAGAGAGEAEEAAVAVEDAAAAGMQEGEPPRGGDPKVGPHTVVGEPQEGAGATEPRNRVPSDAVKERQGTHWVHREALRGGNHRRQPFDPVTYRLVGDNEWWRRW